MATEHFYAGTYWGNRLESAEECARRAHHLFQSLSRCDELFRSWYGLGKSRKDALARPLDVSEASLRALLERDRNRQDTDGSVIEDLGFRLGAWNGGFGGGDCSFSLHCGSHASTPAVWIPNSCALELPGEGEASERVLTVSKLLKIGESMATALDPDWGVVTSNVYQEMVPSGEPGAPIVGWLTYLSVPSRSLPAFPAGVRVVPVSERGSVIVATEERCTATDPRHVEAANAVSRALSASGLLRRIA